MPIDYTTPVGQTRLLIPDTDETRLTFTDEQVAAFLVMASDNPLRAAAQALQTVASDTAMTVAWVRDHDLQIDGPRMAEELRKSAEALYQRAADEDARLASEDFDIVSYSYNFLEDAWASDGN